MTTIQPGVYQHYKGEKYDVLGEAIHSETQEMLVIYQNGGRFWVRPKKMFMEMVEVEGEIVPRFSKITDKYDGSTLDGWGFSFLRQEE